MLFKERYSFEQRKDESRKIMDKYKNRYPIICESNIQDEFKKIKKKFLVSSDLKVGQFLFLIRKKLEIKDPSIALFFFFENGIIPNSLSMFMEIYDDNKNADGFLYMKYGGENTFGK